MLHNIESHETANSIAFIDEVTMINTSYARDEEIKER